MRIRSIERTATIAWAPGQHTPLIATATAAGAYDATFKTNTELEIFDLNLNDSVGGSPSKLKLVGRIAGNSRFNRLAWGLADSSKPLGILVGGMDNGEIDIWNPKSIIDDKKDAVLMHQAAHSGPVRGLDFNTVQTNLFASGATDGEIFVWDLNNLQKPYIPGPRSQKMEDISALSWNKQVGHILATASSNGQTAIWDLRTRKDILTLAYPSGRRTITGLSWNPNHPTQIVTSADDDMNPVILMWDLRNARAPEKTLVGHTKGILSVAWCPKDSDLLLSCGKDNRTIVWNPSKGEVLGDLEHSGNWSFEAQWSTRNPDLIGVASFDGKVTIHSLQNSGTAEDDDSQIPTTPGINVDDPFAMIQRQSQKSIDTGFVLRQTPKWLCRPVGASFGYGGKLVLFGSKSNGSKSVSVKTITTESTFYNNALELNQIIHQNNSESFIELCEKQAALGAAVSPQEQETWKFLIVLLQQGVRENVLKYLGFSKDTIATERLSALFESLKLKSVTPDPTPENIKDQASADAANDFLGTSNFSTPTIPAKPLKLYPASIVKSQENDIDILITRALLVGDFPTAVKICLGADRIADAVMLAVSGGEELLAETQKEYFKRNTDKKSYTRILHGIMNNDLHDIVLNAEFSGVGYKDILALVWTYAKPDEFGTLLGLLGDRMQSLASGTVGKEKDERVFAASLCYLGAGSLQTVVKLWIDAEEKETAATQKRATIIGKKSATDTSRSFRLQALIKKVTIFRKAIGYIDSDAVDANYHHGLESLYKYYAEYAELLMTQGKVDIAQQTLDLIPYTFTRFSTTSECDINPLAILRDRVYKNGGRRYSPYQAPAFPYQIVDISPPKPIVLQEPVQKYQSGYGNYPNGPSYPSYNTNSGGYNTNPYPAPITTPQVYGGHAVATAPFKPYSNSNDISYGTPNVSSNNNQGGWNDAPIPPRKPATPKPISQPPTTFGNPISANWGNTFTPATPRTNAAPPTAFTNTHSAPPSSFNNHSHNSAQPATTLTPAANYPINYSNNTGHGDFHSNTPASTHWNSAPPMNNTQPTLFANTMAPPPTSFMTTGAPPATSFANTHIGYNSNPSPTIPAVQPSEAAFNFGANPNANHSFHSQPTTPFNNGMAGAGPPQGHNTTPFSGMKTFTSDPSPTAVAPHNHNIGHNDMHTGAPVPTRHTSALAAAPAPATPQTPSRHSFGDKSHIPASQMPLVNDLQKFVSQSLQAANGLQQKKMAEDAEKKIAILFDQMNNSEVPQDVVGKLNELVAALNVNDFQNAHRTQLEMMTTRIEVTGGWIVGIKRIIDGVERLKLAPITPSGFPGNQQPSSFINQPPGYSRN